MNRPNIRIDLVKEAVEKSLARHEELREKLSALDCQ
jgi:hypothetical protein